MNGVCFANAEGEDTSREKLGGLPGREVRDNVGKTYVLVPPALRYFKD